MEKKIAKLEQIVEEQNSQIADLMKEVFQLREHIRDMEYDFDDGTN